MESTSPEQLLTGEIGLGERLEWIIETATGELQDFIDLSPEQFTPPACTYLYMIVVPQLINANQRLTGLLPVFVMTDQEARSRILVTDDELWAECKRLRRREIISCRQRAVNAEQQSIQQQLAPTMTTTTERLLAFHWLPVAGVPTHHWLAQLTELNPAQLYLCQYKQLLFELQVKKLHSLLCAYFAFGQATVAGMSELARHAESAKAATMMEAVRVVERQAEIVETIHQFAQPLVKN